MKVSGTLTVASLCIAAPYYVFIAYFAYRIAQSAPPLPSGVLYFALCYVIAMFVAAAAICRRLSTKEVETRGLPSLAPPPPISPFKNFGPVRQELPTIKQTLREAADALDSSLDWHSTLQVIMEKMAAHYRPDTWSLLIVDEEKRELYFAVATGNAAEALKDVRLKLGEGIAGWVARHGEPVMVPNVMTDPRFAKKIDEMIKWETRSLICVPVRSEERNRVLGVVQLVNVDMNSFDVREIACLHILCRYLALAIHNIASD